MFCTNRDVIEIEIWNNFSDTNSVIYEIIRPSLKFIDEDNQIRQRLRTASLKEY